MVNGCREGWKNFDEEYSLYTGKFERTEDSPKGDDTMLIVVKSSELAKTLEAELKGIFSLK